MRRFPVLQSGKQRELYTLWSRIWDKYKVDTDGKRSKSARLNDVVKRVLNREYYTNIVYLKDTECNEVMKALKKEFKSYLLKED